MRPSYLLAISIIAVWIGVALTSGQALWDVQHSRLILTYGAVDGTVFQTHEWWRLITSQWLHSRWQHMLLNATLVAFAGSYLERIQGWQPTLALYFLGGTAAQLASVLAYPDLVSSGASQAMLALCGAAALLPREQNPSWLWYAIVALVGVQLGLDLIVAQTIKAGHGAGLIFGAAWTATFLAWRGLRKTKAAE